jgi:ABC-2 type transport system ATP-binding protein
VLFGRLNRLSLAAARRRADELLEQFELTEAGGRSVKHYSGGMQRRLDLATTLILSPSVLFLDEPTTGLDPRSRNEVWSSIRGLVAGGTPVLLTTQYLDEADQLADRVVVIDTGRTIAEGPPDVLKAQIGGDRLDVVIAGDEDMALAACLVARAAGAEPDVDREARRLSAPVTDRVAALTGVLQALAADGIEVVDVGIRRPTLDDVFLGLTGHKAAA